MEQSFEQVSAVITSAERTQLTSRAQRAGMTVEDFIRRSIAAYDPQQEADLAALARALAHSNRQAAEAVDRALAEVEETRRSLRRQGGDQN